MTDYTRCNWIVCQNSGWLYRVWLNNLSIQRLTTQGVADYAMNTVTDYTGRNRIYLQTLHFSAATPSHHLLHFAIHSSAVPFPFSTESSSACMCSTSFLPFSSSSASATPSSCSSLVLFPLTVPNRTVSDTDPCSLYPLSWSNQFCIANSPSVGILPGTFRPCGCATWWWKKGLSHNFIWTMHSSVIPFTLSH